MGLVLGLLYRPAGTANPERCIPLPLLLFSCAFTLANIVWGCVSVQTTVCELCELPVNLSHVAGTAAGSEGRSGCLTTGLLAVVCAVLLALVLCGV